MRHCELHAHFERLADHASCNFHLNGLIYRVEACLMSVEMTHQQSLAHGARLPLGVAAKAGLTTAPSSSAFTERDARVVGRRDGLW